MRRRTSKRPNSLPVVLGLVQPMRDACIRPNTTLSQYQSKPMHPFSPYPGRKTALWRVKQALSLLDLETSPTAKSTDFPLQTANLPSNLPEIRENTDMRRRSIVVKMPMIAGIADISVKSYAVRPKSPIIQEIRRQKPPKISLFCKWMRLSQGESEPNRLIS